MTTLTKFTADWCAPCRMLDPILDELSKEYPDVTFESVDIEEQPEVARQFAIRSVPTLMLFKSGELLDTRIGAASKAEIKLMLESAK